MGEEGGGGGKVGEELGAGARWGRRGGDKVTNRRTDRQK